MSAERDRFLAAVAAGTLASEDAHRRLLQSIVEAARAIWRAGAASIMLFDEASDELVFEAVAGAGSESLVAQRMPSTPASPAGCSPPASRW